MTSQKFPLQKGTSNRDSIFIPWNRAKLEKSHFLCLKTSFLAQIRFRFMVNNLMGWAKKPPAPSPQPQAPRCLNVNSLLKHIDQLRLFCETHKPHVLCLNETQT